MFGHDHGQPFLGREFSSEPDYSDEIAREIDDEIRRMVEEAHQAARGILEQHREKLDTTSDILLRRETIEREQFIELLEGKAESEVFGPEDRALPAPPPPAPEAPERRPERAPQPLPRPGLAGGTAEMRGDSSPETLACSVGEGRPTGARVARLVQAHLAGDGTLKRVRVRTLVGGPAATYSTPWLESATVRRIV